MNRENLINEVASGTGVSKRRVAAVLNEFLSEVTEALSRDERVTLRHFGLFNVKNRKARIARDLNSNVELPLSNRHMPQFVPYDALKAAVAQQSSAQQPPGPDEKKARKADPAKESLAETRKSLSTLLSNAEKLANSGRFEQAIQQYEDILKQDPEHIVATAGLGRMFFRIGSQGVALQQYNRVLENDPGNIVVLINRAVLFTETGRFQEAKTDLLRALEHEPFSFQACYQLGVLYITVGSYNAAIGMLTRALEAGRPTAEVYLQLGKAYCHVEKHPEAIESFETLLRHDPDNDRAYRYLGLIYDKDKQADKALDMYRKSNELMLGKLQAQSS